MGDCISSFLATQAKAASSSTADSSIGVAAKNIPVIATPAPKVLVKKKQQEVFFRLPVRKAAGLRLQHAATVAHHAVFQHCRMQEHCARRRGDRIRQRT